ncbi:MAG: hypothetical protein ACRDRC_08530 [Pseudonocardiaceae bacterium]
MRNPTDAGYILALLQAHSCHDIAYLAGYVLLARSIDTCGTLRTHTLTFDGQPAAMTDACLTDGQQLRAG